MLKVAILTGGGDCPGLNAVIRAVVRRSEAHAFEIMGVRDGWKGMLEPEGRTQRLTLEAVSDILSVGGTILGTSRTNPFKKPEHVDQVLRGAPRVSHESRSRRSSRCRRPLRRRDSPAPRTAPRDRAG